MKRKIVANLPMRNPIPGLMLWFIFLDHFQAPGWVWGAVGSCWLILLLVWIHDGLNSERVDVFADKGEKQ